ncbi:MAG: Peptidyl-tRNA hydrolase ArfB [Lentisphaerae bacterium ADurb.Bin242]|nr:MAG: Peptidyl-tRNA hydrolase ArfB [Lentisphaerae bacterium ADurb.Bin242]
MTQRTDFKKEDIPETDLREEFFCAASGPGGQHVNKTATAVRLIFDATNTTLLNESAKIRLRILAGTRTDDGSVVIFCKETRSLALNREIARERLAELIAAALKEPRKRKKTKPSRASRERRLQAKAQRGKVKAGRAEKFMHES